MRTIKQSTPFKRDLKREARGPYRQTLQSDFAAILQMLANDEPLAEKYRDHALSGDGKVTATAISNRIWS
jgi:mRNA interferase YafQ